MHSFKRVFNPLLTFIIFSSLITACASGPQLENYSRSEIDRPFTLPSGVASWTTEFAIDHQMNPSGYPQTSSILDPMIWTQSLSDDWNILWAPIPLGVMYQLNKDDSDRMGLGLLMGASYNSINGFDLRPTLTFSERHYFSKSFAVDASPGLTARLPFQSGQRPFLLAGITFKGVFQLTPTFALLPGFSIDEYRWESNATDLDAQGRPLSEVYTHVVVPLSFEAKWSVSRRWDLNASFTYSKIGYMDGYSDEQGAVNAIYYW